MLHTISVEGFKSIRELEDLELGQVNVFVGANGSGKSNFLEALGVLGAAAAGRVDDQALLRRGVRPGVPAGNIGLKVYRATAAKLWDVRLGGPRWANMPRAPSIRCAPTRALQP